MTDSGSSAATVLGGQHRSTMRNHFSELVRLVRRVVAAGGALGWTLPPPESELRALFGRVTRLAAVGDAFVAAAYHDGCLVGFAYWERYERETNRHNVDARKLIVAPEFRGQGVARGLMYELIKAALEQGVEVITLDVRADNEAAVKIYESMGFVRCGTLPDFIAVGEQRWNKLLYFLDLRGERNLSEPRRITTRHDSIGRQ